MSRLLRLNSLCDDFSLGFAFFRGVYDQRRVSRVRAACFPCLHSRVSLPYVCRLLACMLYLFLLYPIHAMIGWSWISTLYAGVPYS